MFGDWRKISVLFSKQSSQEPRSHPHFASSSTHACNACNSACSSSIVCFWLLTSADRSHASRLRDCSSSSKEAVWKGQKKVSLQVLVSLLGAILEWVLGRRSTRRQVKLQPEENKMWGIFRFLIENKYSTSARVLIDFRTICANSSCHLLWLRCTHSYNYIVSILILLYLLRDYHSQSEPRLQMHLCHKLEDGWPQTMRLACLSHRNFARTV